MAGDATTFIVRLLKSVIGENDWATEIRNNFEAIAEYLGQTGTATLAELNDGTAAIEGEFYGQPYYNTDEDWMAVCSVLAPGGDASMGTWVYASDWLLGWAAENSSYQWEKGQTTKWVVHEDVGTETLKPWITPDPDNPTDPCGNYHIIDAVGAVTIDAPGSLTADTAAILIIGFVQGGGGSIAVWNDVYKMAGGVELPTTEVAGEMDLFSCVRAPNGNWMVSPAFKFDVEYTA